MVIKPRPRCSARRVPSINKQGRPDLFALKSVTKATVPTARLLEDLEAVKADKVSLEWLLRERLERHVQSEVEARVSRMHQEDGGLDELVRRQVDGLRQEVAARARNEGALREEIKRLKHGITLLRGSNPPCESDDPDEHLVQLLNELQDLRAQDEMLREAVPQQNAKGSGGTCSSRAEASAQGPTREGVLTQQEASTVPHEDAGLRDRCEALVGERKAIQTIMEKKVQVLVDNLAESASAVLQVVAAQDEQLLPSKEEEDDDDRESATAQLATADSSPANNTTHALPKKSNAAVDKRSTTSNSTAATASRRALTKDVGQLRRLVQATISALKTAEAQDVARSTRGACPHPPPKGRGAAVRVQGGDGDGDDGKELDTCRGEVNSPGRQEVFLCVRSDPVVGCPVERRPGQEPANGKLG